MRKATCESEFDTEALEAACRLLGRRALVEGNPGLARRFHGGLVKRWEPEQDRAGWLRRVQKQLMEDEVTRPMLIAQLLGQERVLPASSRSGGS